MPFDDTEREYLPEPPSQKKRRPGDIWEELLDGLFFALEFLPGIVLFLIPGAAAVVIWEGEFHFYHVCIGGGLSLIIIPTVCCALEARDRKRRRKTEMYPKL